MTTKQEGMGLTDEAHHTDAAIRASSFAHSGEGEWRVASDYLLTNALGLSKERQNNNHAKRLAAAMRGLGWTRSDTPIRFGKIVRRGFTKPVDA